jgi:hypothetical protein
MKTIKAFEGQPLKASLHNIKAAITFIVENFRNIQNI